MIKENYPENLVKTLLKMFSHCQSKLHEVRVSEEVYFFKIVLAGTLMVYLKMFYFDQITKITAQDKILLGCNILTKNSKLMAYSHHLYNGAKHISLILFAL